MVEAGLLAYPFILGTMIALGRLGRDEAWGVFEWLRLGALAMLLGAAVAVQVRFLSLGMLDSTAALAAALVSLVGMCLWCGLYLQQHWRDLSGAARDGSLRAG